MFGAVAAVKSIYHVERDCSLMDSIVPKRELAMREEVDVRTGCCLMNLVKFLMNLAPLPQCFLCARY